MTAPSSSLEAAYPGMEGTAAKLLVVSEEEFGLELGPASRLDAPTVVVVVDLGRPY